MEVRPMFCMKCGHKNDDGDRFCEKCGAPLIYDNGAASGKTARGRGDETHISAGTSRNRRYGDDFSGSQNRGYGFTGSQRTAGGQNPGYDIPDSQRTAGGQNFGYDIPDSQRTAGGQNSGYDIPDSQRTSGGQNFGDNTVKSNTGSTNRDHRYGDDGGDSYPHISPGTGPSRRKSTNKKNKTNEKEKTSGLRIALATLISLAFVATAGIMLYQVFSRKDTTVEIPPVEETASNGQDSTVENVAESMPDVSSENTTEYTTGQVTAEGSEGGQTDESDEGQTPFMVNYGEDGETVVEGNTTQEDTGAAGSGGGMVDMEPVDQEASDSPGEEETSAIAMAIQQPGTTSAESTQQQGVTAEGGPAQQQGTSAEAEPAQQRPTTATLLPAQTGPNLAGYKTVNVVNASASSTIVQTKTDNNPMKLFDGRDDSTWQEGVQGYGMGEFVSWNMDRKYNIKYIGFKLGNWVNDYYYYGNAKPKTITLTVGDFTGQVTFTNDRAVQWVELSNEVTADSMKLVINDVFPGTTWQDTCITEILVYGK